MPHNMICPKCFNELIEYNTDPDAIFKWWCEECSDFMDYEMDFDRDISDNEIDYYLDLTETEDEY